MPEERESWKLLNLITGIFSAALVISNVASSGKFVALGPLVLPGGLVLFPLTYIFGDILTEVYGYRKSREVIWTGFAALALASLTFLIVGALPEAPFRSDKAAYEKILGFLPRMVMASMIAYLAGEFCNSFILSKLKFRSGGRRGVSQAWRFVASTIVGEGVDSIVFMIVAFAGILSVPEMVRTGGSLYLFKVVYEIVMTPVSVRVSNWVKTVEGDHIDDPAKTSYNPFAIFGKGFMKSRSG